MRIATKGFYLLARRGVVAFYFRGVYRIWHSKRHAEMLDNEMKKYLGG